MSPWRVALARPGARTRSRADEEGIAFIMSTDNANNANRPASGSGVPRGIAVQMLDQSTKRRTGEYVPGSQEGQVALTSVADMLKWAQNYARSRSIWPLGYGLACCAIEMMAAAQSHYDLSRWGSEVFRSSPRQADLMIVAGTVCVKMGPRLVRLYEQMPDPKWVLSLGQCATSGGEFYDSYYTVQGVDTLVPVDIYVPGCPPRPEALIEGILKLREKIEKQGLKIRGED
jgi:NADH-quinone oxidoreductase subunit B